MFREMFDFIYHPKETFSSWDRVSIYSMAKLGSLKALPRNKRIPYKLLGSNLPAGEVDLPQDFSNLLDVADDWHVWFNGDAPTGKPAFRLESVGSNHGLLSGIKFLFGVNSEITQLQLESAFSFICNVPAGFTVNSLVKLLSSDERTLDEFVLKYGVLNKVQKEFIQKKGLDGLRG